VHQLNKIATPVWLLSSRLLGTRQLSKLTLKLFDKSVWLWRRFDWLLPWRGLSAVVVARASGRP
jgi:hypothetical protein